MYLNNVRTSYHIYKQKSYQGVKTDKMAVEAAILRVHVYFFKGLLKMIVKAVVWNNNRLLENGIYRNTTNIVLFRLAMST